MISRPFKAIPEVREIHDTLILSPASMTRTIQSSDVLGHIFHNNCQLADGKVSGRRIKNLSLRKHRFDSVQKPTGRTILYIDAVIMTAIYASVHRKGQRDGDRANAFLSYINERRLLLLAMMADAADECIVLVRFLDSEDYELSTFMLEIESCMSRLHFLFVEAGLHLWKQCVRKQCL